jgi:hypothetical protein
VAEPFCGWAIDLDTEFHRTKYHRGLGNRALLIGREHDALDRSRGLGWAVSG